MIATHCSVSKRATHCSMSQRDSGKFCRFPHDRYLTLQFKTMNLMIRGLAVIKTSKTQLKSYPVCNKSI